MGLLVWPPLSGLAHSLAGAGGAVGFGGPPLNWSKPLAAKWRAGMVASEAAEVEPPFSSSFSFSWAQTLHQDLTEVWDENLRRAPAGRS
jgi:hypothetical protein